VTRNARWTPAREILAAQLEADPGTQRLVQPGAECRDRFLAGMLRAALLTPTDPVRIAVSARPRDDNGVLGLAPAPAASQLNSDRTGGGRCLCHAE